jgi:hypothetical protein
MTSWYSILIKLPDNKPIFRGYFSVNNANNTVTSFYDITQPNKNIYINNGKAGEDSIFNLTPFYSFTFNGTNITSIPYFKKQGDNSSWFNLYYNNNNRLQYPNGSYIDSENKNISGLLGYSVNMTFKTIRDPFMKNNFPVSSLVMTSPMDYSNPSYPSGKNHRSTFYKTMFDTTLLPYGKQYNNCNNNLCYTYSKNYIYKPHSDYGMVGTSAAGYLAQRKRL